MAVIELNRNPSRKELAWFGVLMAAFLGIAGLVVRHRFDAPTAGLAIWAAGVAVPALYYAVPSVMRPVYLGWLHATYPIGFVVSHVLLGAIYFVLFTLVGLLLRAMGRDPMNRRFDPRAASYWSEHRPCEAPPSRYFRQY